jgi:hypothetical protein
MEKQEMRRKIEMLAIIEAKIDAWGEKMDAETRVTQAWTEAMLENMGATHEEMEIGREPKTKVKTMACQKMKSRLEEERPTSVETKPEVETQDEVPNVDAVVQPVKGRKRRYRGKRKAARLRGKPKELTRGDCGSRRKLTAACRKVSRRATVARLRRDVFVKEWTQNQDGCQKKCVAHPGRLTHRTEVARKMQADKKMPRHATVARRTRDIFRPNTAQRAGVVRCKANAIGKVRVRNNVVRETWKG